MNDNNIIRPSIGTILLFGVVVFAFLFMSGYAFFTEDAPITYMLAAGIVLILFIVWMSTVSIVMTMEGITYNSGFGRSAQLSWPDIQVVRTGVNIHSTGSGVGGEYQTLLQSNNPSKKNIKINIKLFGKRDLMTFAGIVIKEAKSALIDNATQAMAEGRMPSAFIPQKRSKPQG